MKKQLLLSLSLLMLGSACFGFDPGAVNNAKNRTSCHHCDFSGADLTGFNLSDRDFNNSNFTNAILKTITASGTQLFNCNFTDAHMENIVLKPNGTFENAILVRAHLESANLQKANLRGANFGGAYLNGADLRGADLTNANLTNADLTNIKIDENTNFQNAAINKAYTMVNGQKQECDPKLVQKLKGLGAILDPSDCHKVGSYAAIAPAYDSDRIEPAGANCDIVGACPCNPYVQYCPCKNGTIRQFSKDSLPQYKTGTHNCRPNSTPDLPNNAQCVALCNTPQ